MSWVKLDDQFPDHPKVIAAGGDAAWLYVAGLCYCQAKLTDGVIPAGIVPRLTDRKNPLRLAERLVEVRLWEPLGSDYRIHDYHDLNTAAEKVKAKREATRKRVTEWREKRACNAVTNAIGNAGGNAAPLTANRDPLTANHQETLAQPPAGAGVGQGIKKAAKAVRPKRPAAEKAPPPPMPFSIDEMLSALEATSQGQIIVSPFDRSLAKPLTAVIRGLDESKCTLDDVRLAGEYAAAVVPTWPTPEPLGLGWLATGGKLSTMIGKARSWRDRGRTLAQSTRPSGFQRPEAPRPAPPEFVPLPRAIVPDDPEERRRLREQLQSSALKESA